MFFKIDPGYNGTDWYLNKTKLEDSTKALIPDVDLIYWDRDGTGLPDGVNFNRVFPFSYIIDNAVSILKKIKPFVKFRKHILNVLKACDYDRVIALDTQFCVLINDVLRKKYKNKVVPRKIIIKNYLANDG